MNHVWTMLLVISVVFALAAGADGGKRITQGVIDGAENAVAFAFGLAGTLAFWSGMMKLAEASGLTAILAKLLSPVVRRLFPSIPPDDPANASIVMAISANALGLGNAATPLGLKAMYDLSRLNAGRNEASDAMCTFLVISTSGITLIPGSVIAIRAAAGSNDPTAIVLTTFLATVIATAVAVVADGAVRAWRHGR